MGNGVAELRAVAGLPVLSQANLHPPALAAPSQEPFPPPTAEGFAPRGGGGGELRGFSSSSGHLVSLLMEPKLSLVGSWGFPPSSCLGAGPAPTPAPEAPRAAGLVVAGDEETKRGSASGPGLIPACRGIPRSPGQELERSRLVPHRARGFCSGWGNAVRADEEDRWRAPTAIDLRSEQAISPCLVPLKEKLLLAASSALPS